MASKIRHLLVIRRSQQHLQLSGRSLLTTSVTSLKSPGVSTRHLNSQSTNDPAKMAINIGGMRKPYRDASDTFDIKDLESKDPFVQFEAWFQDAKKDDKTEEPNAMCIATATKTGIPSCRMVLLKSYGTPTSEDLKLDPEAQPGFVFFTNYDSRKGHELMENPRCAIMFYWETLKRSIRIEGTVTKTSQAYSDAYFHSRPLGSQIGACVGQQSQVVANRQTLNDIEATLKETYKESVPKPENWGGFRVVPTSFEFWQGQSTRIHDRLRFRKLENGEELDEAMAIKAYNDWLIERLSP